MHFVLSSSSVLSPQPFVLIKERSMVTSEQALRNTVSLDNLTRYNAEIAKGVRLSGSADEAEAFAYLAAQCRSYGMEVQEYAIDAYVSLPGAAALTVTSPEERPLSCITHSFSLA